MADPVKAQAAYARLAAILKDRPTGPVPVKAGVDADGDPVYRDVEPLVQVVAGDTFALADLVPKDKRTDTVRALRKGSGAVAADRLVHQQVKCLRHLLEEVKPYLPAAAAEPARPASEA